MLCLDDRDCLPWRLTMNFIRLWDFPGEISFRSFEPSKSRRYFLSGQAIHPG